jgi:hypothetical protein
MHTSALGCVQDHGGLPRTKYSSGAATKGQANGVMKQQQYKRGYTSHIASCFSLSWKAAVEAGVRASSAHLIEGQSGLLHDTLAHLVQYQGPLQVSGGFVNFVINHVGLCKHTNDTHALWRKIPCLMQRLMKPSEHLHTSLKMI